MALSTSAAVSLGAILALAAAYWQSGKTWLNLLFTTLGILLILYGQYAFTVYKTWEQHFAGKRVSRKIEFSPSHSKEPPNLRQQASVRKRVLKATTKRPDRYGLRQSSLMNLFRIQEEDATTTRQPVTRRDRNFRGSASGLQEGNAPELDMDHVFVPFLDFLWANTFIGPNALVLWARGVMILKVRQLLVKMGLFKVRDFDPAVVAARLCLEGTLAMYYRVRHKEKRIAAFYFPACPIIMPDGSFTVKDLLAVDIDLDQKRLIKARLDEEELTPSQALTVLWYKTISDNHTKLHAYANWGVNVESEQVQNNPFHARNSLVTVIYNYYGFTSFVSFFPTWKKMGLLSERWDPEALLDTFRHGIKNRVAAHTRVDELMPDSTLVNFIVKVRAIFVSEFFKHKSSFPGTHSEAMFVGTILHSLDHTCMEWNLDDPLWLDVDDPRFGLMAELGRVVRVGFVEDLPGLYFSRKFKGCGHPFYEAVYQKAAKINKKLADSMDTCIVK